MRGADFVSLPTLDQLCRESDLTQQRRDAIAASDVAVDERIGVPANASRALVDAVKSTGGRPVFCPLDEWLRPMPPADVRIVWVQSFAGHVPDLGPLRDHRVLVDAGDAFVSRNEPGVAGPRIADGHLLVAQRAAVAAVAMGVVGAAGLDTCVVDPSSAVVPMGVAVRLPADADVTTFVAYLEGEQTGAQWAPRRRPLHSQAQYQLTADECAQSAQNLSRFVHLPVGPSFDDEHVDHSVLGVVKTAEYTGWRWINDRAQVAWYESWLVEKYGTGHDAYRPSWPVL